MMQIRPFEDAVPPRFYTVFQFFQNFSKLL
jgi:hypothetical protein